MVPVAWGPKGLPLPQLRVTLSMGKVCGNFTSFLADFKYHQVSSHDYGLCGILLGPIQIPVSQRTCWPHLTWIRIAILLSLRSFEKYLLSAHSDTQFSGETSVNKQVEQLSLSGLPFMRVGWGLDNEESSYLTYQVLDKSTEPQRKRGKRTECHA